MKKSIVLWLALSFLTLGIVNAQEVTPLNAGDPFPADFKFQNLKGDSITISAFKGKYIYIDVWGSWCDPCKKAIPDMKKLEEKFKKKNIAFVSIADDKELDWRVAVAKYKVGGTPLRFLSDSDFVYFKNLFKLFYVPAYILLDREGKVLWPKMVPPSFIEAPEILSELEGI